MQEPDTQPGPYYISAIDGLRTSLVSGPYEKHADALALVDQARVVAERHDRRALWYAFGTVRMKAEYTAPGMLQKWGYTLALEKVTA